MDNLRNSVIKIVCDFSVTGCINGTDDLLSEDLGYDSLSLVSLIVELEDNLNISFDISELDPDKLIKVIDIIDLVENSVK